MKNRFIYVFGNLFVAFPFAILHIILKIITGGFGTVIGLLYLIIVTSLFSVIWFFTGKHLDTGHYLQKYLDLLLDMPVWRDLYFFKLPKSKNNGRSINQF